jgi:hypothetical protein
MSQEKSSGTVSRKEIQALCHGGIQALYRRKALYQGWSTGTDSRGKFIHCTPTGGEFMHCSKRGIYAPSKGGVKALYQGEN